MGDTEILTTVQAAELLGVSTSRVRQLLLANKLDGWKADGPPNRTDWKISKQSVERYLVQKFD